MERGGEEDVAESGLPFRSFAIIKNCRVFGFYDKKSAGFVFSLRFTVY